MKWKVSVSIRMCLLQETSSVCEANDFFSVLELIFLSFDTMTNSIGRWPQVEQRFQDKKAWIILLLPEAIW